MVVSIVLDHQLTSNLVMRVSRALLMELGLLGQHGPAVVVHVELVQDQEP